MSSLPNQSRRSLQIYAGENVSTGGLQTSLKRSFTGAVIDSVTATQIKTDKTLDFRTLAFFLPGIIGEDSPYLSELGEEGNQAIRDYVESGGVFVGICAGAYYACSRIVYNPPWRAEEKTSEPGLDFFNGLAKGPPKGLAKESTQARYSDCRLVNVSYTDKEGETKTTGILYGNGPALYPDQDDGLMVLARYADVPGNPIAIAAQKTGKGLAIFLGVLPEMGTLDIKAIAQFEALNELNETLRPHEGGRQEIWDMIVDLIKAHNIKLGRVQPLLLHRQP